MSTSDLSSPVWPSIISTTSSVDPHHQKPTPFISISSKDDSNLSSISTSPSNTISIHSLSTPHDQINYDSSQSKHKCSPNLYCKNAGSKVAGSSCQFISVPKPSTCHLSHQLHQSTCHAAHQR